MSFSFTKIYIVAHTLVYIIISALQLPINFFITSLPSNNLVSITINLITFLLNFLTFTTGFVTIDIILWACRFIVMLELLPLFIEFVSGLSKVIGSFFI